MSNSFYTHGAFPSTGSAATSASMRAELDLISAGFDKMPTLSGNANLFVVINSTGTGLTQTAVLPSATFTDTLFTIQDDGDNTRKFQFNAGTVTPGATRIYSVPDANTTLVGTDTTQTLTNKTLTAPVISSIVNTGSLSLPTSTDTLVGRATTDTLTNKTLTSPVIATIVNTGTLTLPTSTDTLVGRATTDTLTNKTLTSPVIATIVNTGTLTLPTSTDTLVGRATTDTLTNKTLTSPVIGTIVNTGTLTLPTSTDTLVGRATTDTLTNKTLTSPVIATIVNTGTLTLPTSTDTLVGRATTDTLTNKTLGAFTISGTVSGGGNQINNVIIGASTPLAGSFTTLSTTGLASLPSTGRSAAAALTVTNPAFLYGVASTYTDTASSGTIAAMAPFYSISGPTLSTSNVTTYTNSATLYIANAPTAGGSATITNPYAVYVAAGAAYFGGGIVNSGLTSGRVVYTTTGGLETSSANLTFNGTTLTANTIGAFTLSGTVAGGGNQINNVIIGTSTPLAGAFTTLSASTSITNTGLTSGRVVYSTTGGLETDSANLTFDGTTLSAAGLSDSGNLTFTGTGNRITGDFSNATYASRVLFQTSTTNGASSIGVIPNGTGVNASLFLDSDSAATNSSRVAFQMLGGSEARLSSAILGTGTYLPMTFYTGGSEAMRISSTAGSLGSVGIGYSSSLSGIGNNGLAVLGYVGIGTTTPTNRLNVVASDSTNIVGASTAGITITNTYTGAYGYSSDLIYGVGGGAGSKLAGISGIYTNNSSSTGGALVFYTNTGSSTFTEKMRITSTGEVGIGTNSPTQKLDVNGIGRMRFSSGTGAGHYLDTTGNASRFFVGTDAVTEAWRVYDSIGGANRIYLDSSGNVGIGTSSPSGKFEVSGGRSWFTANSELYSIAFRYSSSTGVMYMGATNSVSTPSIQFSNSGGSALATIDYNGNVGIGVSTVATNFRTQFLGTTGSNTSAASSGTTQSASAVLRLQAGGGFTGTLDIGQGGGTGSWLQSCDTGNLATTYPLLLNPVGGNVGIGTSSPTVKLDVTGGIKVSGQLMAGTSGSVYSPLVSAAYVSGTSNLYLRNLSGTNRIDSYNDPITATYPLQLNASQITFYIADAEKMRIDASGNVLVTNPAGLGYGTGSGGTVTQATSKSTAVTLNKPTGKITMNAAALAAGGVVEFVFNNSLATNNDLIMLTLANQIGAYGNYNLWGGTFSGGGGFYINVKNISGGSLSDALVINFAIIKGATS